MCQPPCTTLKASIPKLLSKVFCFGKQDWSKNGYILVSCPMKPLQLGFIHIFVLRRTESLSFWINCYFGVVAHNSNTILQDCREGVCRDTELSCYLLLRWWCVIHSSNNFNLLVETKRLTFLPAHNSLYCPKMPTWSHFLVHYKRKFTICEFVITLMVTHNTHILKIGTWKILHNKRWLPLSWLLVPLSWLLMIIGWVLVFECWKLLTTPESSHHRWISWFLG